MYLVRNVFQAKPLQAKALAEKLLTAAPILKELGYVTATRVMTDACATFWTVVLESEIEDLPKYLDGAKGYSQHPEFNAAMAGYTDLVTGGHREIYRIEGSV